jgi:hypothetical protein
MKKILLNKNMEKKMKRYLLVALGIAILLLVMPTKPLLSQVYTEYQPATKIYAGSYKELVNPVLLPQSSFVRINVDTNDGYCQIPIGFPFEFNSQIYDRVWICVNGFITFSDPLNLIQNQPLGLFTFDQARYQTNVIAPFWGDHNYRSDSRIYYKTEAVGQNTVLTVEWYNLNVNDPNDPTKRATFQVKLFKSPSDTTNQGDIEFAYSTSSGSNVGVGPSIGIKGGDWNDYINALYWNEPSRQSNTISYSTAWQPTGATDSVFYFKAIPRFTDLVSWGDGDADLSKTVKHKGLPQNRFVTINDAFTIMRSITSRIPLDSTLGRLAYHGDVNHNGRYYYKDTVDVNNLPTKIKRELYWKDDQYTSNLRDPFTYDQLASVKLILFQVTEFDASYILHFLGNRIPQLPWLIDTTILYGKMSPREIATGIHFGNMQLVGQNEYRMPVYLNGYANGPVSFRFDVDGNIENVENAIKDNDNILITNSDNRVVYAASGEFFSEQPICYVTLSTDKKAINVTELKYNDKTLQPLTAASVENTVSGELMLQNSPNPFTDNTEITLNINEAGNYTLSIYDVNGNRIKTIMNSYLNGGVQVYNWNGIDEAGNKVPTGMYVYRLIGPNTNVSMKMILN